MEVLAVASEAFPLIKTGGLADVVGALPAALRGEGVTTRTLLPGYPAVTEALGEGKIVWRWDELFGGHAHLLVGTARGLDLFVLDAPHLFARAGNPYVASDGRDWPDNAFRFAALARVGAWLARGLLPSWRPDCVHAHDWQAALLPAYLRYDGPPHVGSVMTVHNLAFQGIFPAALLTALGLPPHALSIDGVEYFGGIGFLKGGIRLADKITTVSPTYAREILTPEFGMALDGLLFWWFCLKPAPEGERPHPGYGVRVAILALIAFPQVLLGCYIFLSPKSLYSVYNLCGRAWEISPLLDQQIGGLIIWIPGSMMSVIAAIPALRQWMRADGKARGADTLALGAGAKSPRAI